MLECDFKCDKCVDFKEKCLTCGDLTRIYDAILYLCICDGGYFEIN